MRETSDWRAPSPCTRPHRKTVAPTGLARSHPLSWCTSRSSWSQTGIGCLPAGTAVRSIAATTASASRGPPECIGRSAVELPSAWLDRSRPAVAADLGVLIMHELALTLRPRPSTALRRARGMGAQSVWRRQRRSDKAQRGPGDPCATLWSARARLLDWLNPLNIPGLNEDLDKAWLPATDHEEVKRVDRRVDKAPVRPQPARREPCVPPSTVFSCSLRRVNATGVSAPTPDRGDGGDLSDPDPDRWLLRRQHLGARGSGGTGASG